MNGGELRVQHCRPLEVRHGGVPILVEEVKVPTLQKEFRISGVPGNSGRQGLDLPVQIGMG